MSGVGWGAKTFVDDTHLNTGTNKLSSSSIFLWKIGNKKRLGVAVKAHFLR